MSLNAEQLRKVREDALARLGGEDRMIEYLEGLMLKAANEFRLSVSVVIDYKSYEKGIIKIDRREARLNVVTRHLSSHGFTVNIEVRKPTASAEWGYVFFKIFWES